jgi:LysM repeat protein
MKTRRHVVLVSLTVILLLLGTVLAPAASAAPAAGAACPPVYYRVVRGDWLATIAWRYGVTVWQLQQWNHINNPNRIYAGTLLVIHPSRCAAPQPKPLPNPPTGPIGIPAPLPAPLPVPVPLPWPPAPVSSCPDQRAVITSPGSGQQVSGMVTIKGNATHENFSFYKLEYGAGSNPATWSWFFGGQWPIWQGTLGALNAGVLPSGTYTIRVTVVDKTSNYPPPCQVTVVVR